VDKEVIELVKEVIALAGALIVLISAIVGIRSAAKHEVPYKSNRQHSKSLRFGLISVLVTLSAGAAAFITYMALGGSSIPPLQNLRPHTRTVETTASQTAVTAVSPTTQATPSSAPNLAARRTPTQTWTMNLASHYGLGVTHNRGSLYEYHAVNGSISVEASWTGQEVARCVKQWSSNRGGGQYIFRTCNDEKAVVEVQLFD